MSIVGVDSVTLSYLAYYGSLSQNATDIITKCDGLFITKCNRNLLQNATVLLENAQLITKWDNFIIKCDAYYELRQYTHLLIHLNLLINVL